MKDKILIPRLENTVHKCPDMKQKPYLIGFLCGNGKVAALYDSQNILSLQTSSYNFCPFCGMAFYFDNGPVNGGGGCG